MKKCFDQNENNLMRMKFCYYALVNSKHQQLPPGEPRGFALYCCSGAWDLYLMTFLGGRVFAYP